MTEQNRDLTLAPDTYLYLQNVGKGGIITIYRGPCVVSQTGQDSPIIYADSRFTTVPRLEGAVQVAPRANEGDYVILDCPAADGSFPTEISQPARALKKGCKIIIPGPWSEALWPGQKATVIEGHRLRSNQYLIAIIYNAEEAAANWSKTIVETETPSSQLPTPDSFAVGTRIIIKGTDVSFYIPCTGVEVVRDPKTRSYVREAVTLEQSEYCCLVGEDGKKQYPKGPKVVFPAPDQVFDEDAKGHRKFRPIELNTINGIHCKVTADFEDIDYESTSGTREYIEGEELFITGKTCAIFYPREELSIIKYGEREKHFSTAIPKGEGRYVINRESGEIKLILGPKMLLVDPRYEILVRRQISIRDCELWYPGNMEAKEYNLKLGELISKAPSGRSGVISEGDYTKSLLGDITHKGIAAESTDTIGKISRSTTYTKPREIQLNTKYDGAPRIEVWPGYAILVLGAAGSRRVVKGPEVVLLEYDEKLGAMELSTGKPKTSDKLLSTAYLCIHNNQVGDIIPFESSNHVKGYIKISLRVNFEGEDMLRWFSISNYVKYLCDHVRSIIAGMGKRHTIAEIKTNYVDLIRNAILGERTEDGRPGLFFEDNGMRVVEVEVLDIQLNDPTIAQLLDQAQTESIKQLIEIDQAKANLDAVIEQERITQEKLAAKQTTKQYQIQLDRDLLKDELSLALGQFQSELEKLQQAKINTEAKENLADVSFEAGLARVLKREEQEIDFELTRQNMLLAKLDAETAAAVKRLETAKDGLHEALVALQRDDIAAKLTEACNIERWLSGDSVTASISNLLSMFPAIKGFLANESRRQSN